MFSKFCTYLIFNLIFVQYGSTENCDLNECYQYFSRQIDSVKNSIENINTRLDVVALGHYTGSGNVEPIDNSHQIAQGIFDIRYDSLPDHCETNVLACTCAQAMECTGSTGIYNITVTRYSDKTFQAYCDNDNFGGDWLYILKRQDGSVNFSRPLLEYVNGFGDVAGEYWIGLENLYALTNFNGPQELLVFLENFDGKQVFARYDNFVIGSADEKYNLKSLGRYSGTAGDSMFNQLGAPFSTFDSDSDTLPKVNCALDRQGGFWFKDCTKANPTGKYHRGIYKKLYEGAYWRTFNGENYSQKTIIFMIRRQRPMQLDNNSKK